MLARSADSIAALSLALLLGVEVHGAYSTSITTDETAHIGPGVSHAFHGECFMFPEHPPH